MTQVTSRTTTRRNESPDPSDVPVPAPALRPYVVEQTFDDVGFVLFVPDPEDVEWMIADRRARKSLPTDHVPPFRAVEMRLIEGDP